MHACTRIPACPLAWWRNEPPEMIKCLPFSQSIRKFRFEDKWKGNFPENPFGNCGLFFPFGTERRKISYHEGIFRSVPSQWTGSLVGIGRKKARERGDGPGREWKRGREVGGGTFKPDETRETGSLSQGLFACFNLRYVRDWTLLRNFKRSQGENHSKQRSAKLATPFFSRFSCNKVPNIVKELTSLVSLNSITHKQMLNKEQKT